MSVQWGAAERQRQEYEEDPDAADCGVTETMDEVVRAMSMLVFYVLIPALLIAAGLFTWLVIWLVQAVRG